MSQLELKKIAKDLVEQTEREIVPNQQVGSWLNSYFIGELKRAEMTHAEVDTRLYEGLRCAAEAEIAPLYLDYRRERDRIFDRRHKRSFWKYIVFTVGVMECLEALLTKGRSLMPQVLIPTVMLYGFMGFVIFMVTGHLEDLQLWRARKRFEAALGRLEGRVQTDADYDNRRELLQADVLQAEAMEILVQYPKAEDFWRDYQRVREVDPTTPSAVAALKLPAFEKFLKYHAQGAYSTAARQHRFNRLFLEAEEIFVSRDRAGYVPEHLKQINQSKP